MGAVLNCGGRGSKKKHNSYCMVVKAVSGMLVTSRAVLSSSPDVGSIGRVYL